MTGNAQILEVLFLGWLFGVQSCILYASVSGYLQVKRRNRQHRLLLAAGLSVQKILEMD